MHVQGETTNDKIPGTSVLLGMGRGESGELWSPDIQSTCLTVLGREFDHETEEVKVRQDGYTVDHEGEQWLMSQGQRHIKQVACGSLHVILLEFNGRCWTLGDNDDGQLGLGHCTKTRHPTLVQGVIEDQRIEYVGAGGWFSAFLSDKGKVFTCGNLVRQFRDKIIQYFIASDQSKRSKTKLEPREVIMHDDYRIYKMGCGNRFLLMQDQITMKMYYLGQSNSHRGVSLGEQMDPNISLMHYIHPETLDRSPVDFQCKKIDGGEAFSVLLDYKGTLFTAAGVKEDFMHVETLHKVPVIDVCCSWMRYIALDADGLVHLGGGGYESKIVTLHSLGPVNQIGAGQVRMYVRSGKTVYKMSEGHDHQTAPEELSFRPKIDQDENTFVQLTGSYFTTIIHQAVVKRSLQRNTLNMLRLGQLLCDVTVVCAFSDDEDT